MNDYDKDSRGGGRGGSKDKAKGKDDKGARRGGFFRRRRVCKFCVEKIDYV